MFILSVVPLRVPVAAVSPRGCVYLYIRSLMSGCGPPSPIRSPPVPFVPVAVEASGIVEFKTVVLLAGGYEAKVCLCGRPPADLMFASIIYFLISMANMVCLLSV